MFKYILFLFAISFSALSVESEKYYSDNICKNHFNGKPTRTSKGLYVDCLTDTLAIEFDWAKQSKTYECIGQAIVYAVQTDRLPMCVMLSKNNSDYKIALKQLPYFNKANVSLIIIKVK